MIGQDMLKVHKCSVQCVTFWLDFNEVYHMAWKSGRLFASQRIRRDFWTLSRESLLIERAKNGTSRWSCKADASWSCGKKRNVFDVINLFIQIGFHL